MRQEPDAGPFLGRTDLSRAVAVALVLLLAGCASASRSRSESRLELRPAPQALGNHQVVGESIVTSLGGASVRVQWLSQKGMEGYYHGRPGLTLPWPEEMWRQAPPTVFLLRIRNTTREEAQFDPTLAALVPPDGRRARPIPYEEMYMRMAGKEEEAPRLRSLEATLLSRFVVLPPGSQREGLLIFPAPEPKAKHLLLELSSFFVGGKPFPGLFECQVVPTEKNRD